MTICRPLAFAICAVAVLTACDDAPDVELPDSAVADEASVAARDAASAVAECDQAADGQLCGDGGGVMHCLYNACVLNVCGDGIKAGDEFCDDGDQEDADGCNSRCQEPLCGNGLLDAREQCDDGNTTNGDDCSSTCRDLRTDAGSMSRADAGSGVDAAVDSGTGGSSPDAGSPAGDAGIPLLDSGVGASDTGVGPHDTGAGPDDTGTAEGGAQSDAGPTGDAGPSACQQCVRAATSPCIDWLFSGPDNVANCFQNPDPTWVERCVALYRCAVTAPDRCAEDPTGVTKCYCGTTPIETCFTGAASAQPNGPCIAQTNAATNCTTPQCVEGLINSESTPSYAAFYLTLCTTSPDACGPSCPAGQRFP